MMNLRRNYAGTWRKGVFRPDHIREVDNQLEVRILRRDRERFRCADSGTGSGDVRNGSGDEEMRMQQSEIDLLERYEGGLKGRCWIP
jgi:hypothetical protein